jgi:EpsI family protein
MRGNIAIRFLIAAVIVAVTYLGMYVVAWGIQVPEAVLPSWNIKDLPMQLGEWKGEDVKLDERLFRATGANSIVERQYKNESGTVISIHLAVFKDANEGVWHNPISCYESAGWVPVEITRTPIFETQENSDKIALSTWEKSGGERTIVGYWYQLGEHRLYGRWDLGFSVRWQMRGRKTWPALIKVLLSVGAGSKQDVTKTQLLKFAESVHQWINQPEHQTKDEPADAVPAASK